VEIIVEDDINRQSDVDDLANRASIASERPHAQGTNFRVLRREHRTRGGRLADSEFRSPNRAIRCVKEIVI
jgi:hypothetical protein